jgi:hypothetical protein
VKDWKFGVMFVGAVCGFAAIVVFMETRPSPARCWATPDEVPKETPVYISTDHSTTPWVCEEREHPRCWEMTELRGKECEGK